MDPWRARLRFSVNISGPSSLTLDPTTPVAVGVSASNRSASATPSSASADLSLVIEDDKAAGELVYKTVNRVTGAVVNQYPNAQMVKLREESDYIPGEVVRQSA